MKLSSFGHLCHEVTAICNVLVINHRVPRDWAHALIQRIPKKNYDPEDYEICLCCRVYIKFSSKALLNELNQELQRTLLTTGSEPTFQNVTDKILFSA